ncbi:phage major capsid protein [Streptomyces sp. NPDC055722]
MALARKALEARGRIFEEYKSVLADTKITDADKRERLEKLDSAIEAKSEEVRDFTAKAEGETEARKMGIPVFGTGAGGDTSAWGATCESRGQFLIPSGREYTELRDLTTNPASSGVAVTNSVYDQFVTSLRKKSSFLAAGVNLTPITDGGKLQVPVVNSDGSAGVVAEGSPIPVTDMTVVDGGFTAYKVADAKAISSELLEDSSPDVRQAVSDALIRNTAAAVDDFFYSGTGTAQPIGITKIAGVVSTALSAAVTLDNLADEMAAIEAQGGTVTAILTDPGTFNVIRKAKASTAGVYHSTPFMAQDGPGRCGALT